MTDLNIETLIAATCYDKPVPGGPVIQNASYYNCVLARCKVYENKQARTMGVCFDKSGDIVLLYNPDFLKTLTDGQAIQILKHEALHIFFQHFPRFKGKNHERANVAEDMEINQDLEGLPKGAVYPETYGFKRGNCAEAYYMGLKENKLFNQQQMSMKKSDEQLKTDKMYDDRSCEDGKPIPGMEAGLDNHDLHDKVVDSNGNIVGDVDSEHVDTVPRLEQIHQKVLNALRNMGNENIPGWGKQALEIEFTKSNNNWKYLLRMLIGSILDINRIYSQKRRDRRMAAADPVHFYPGQKYGLEPKVLCVRDTSGSMFDTTLQKEVLNEIMNITRHAEVYVCDCDTEVHDCYRVNTASDFRDYQGGGGTSFVEPFELAKKLQVDAIIYLTDLYGDFPDPGKVGKFYHKTVWVTTEDNKETVPFGKVVKITR